jgi:hypothetical protein
MRWEVYTAIKVDFDSVAGIAPTSDVVDEDWKVSIFVRGSVATGGGFASVAEGTRSLDEAFGLGDVTKRLTVAQEARVSETFQFLLAKFQTRSDLVVCLRIAGTKLLPALVFDGEKREL